MNSGITTNSGETISLAGGGSDFFGALQAGTGGGTWAGGVTLADAAVRLGATAGNTLTVTGSIADGAGTGFTVSGQGGTGVVVINPTTSNSYSGTTSVLRGTLRIGKTDALPVGTVLDVDSVNGVADAAIFDLAGFDQTVAALQDTATTNINGIVTNSVAATISTLTVNGGASTIFNGAIQNGAGTVALTKNGGGTLTLVGSNTFSGATLVSGGTLEAGAANALSATANVTINTGGTLLLSNTGTTGRISDAATVNLAGGTVAFVGNVSETTTLGTTAGIGALTLTLGSVIDFAGGNAVINFGASNLASWMAGETLSIYNWDGLMSGGGNDRLIFGIDSTALTSGQLGQISFYDGGLGSNFLGTGTFVGSLGEVVPVPEPSSVATVMGLLGLVGWRERRKAQSTRRATRK